MNFVDKVLVRLADPATRGSLFDGAALEQFAAAAYDTSQMTVEGPFNAVFDEVRLGVAIPRTGSAEGQWGGLGSSERSGANFNFTGFGGAPFVIDATWRGYIVARVSAPTGRISSVRTDWPDASAIDRDIVAALGALPADPGALGIERRTRLMARLRDAVADDDVVTDAVVDRLLASVGASSINDFFEHHSRTSGIGPVQITISPGPDVPPSPKPLPVSAAILVRDGAAGLAQLLADSKLVREQMESAGMGRPADPALRMLQSVLVVWVLPQSAFNDDDLPGANAAARRTAAGAWLAREGIGLATVA